MTSGPLWETVKLNTSEDHSPQPIHASVKNQTSHLKDTMIMPQDDQTNTIPNVTRAFELRLKITC